MNPRFASLIIAMTVCLILGAGISATAASGSGPRRGKAGKTQTGSIAVIVNGRVLSGPNSTARRDGETFLVPLRAVAAALSDTLTVEPAARRISIRRQDGVEGYLDAAIGQIVMNGSVAHTFANAGTQIFSGNPGETMLPAAAASVLFDASISYDSIRNQLKVSRGAVYQPSAVASGASRRVADLYTAEYEYSLSRYSSTSSHTAVLNATGRVGDGRFFLTTNAVTSPNRRISPRNLNLTIERPNTQRFVAGDLGTGSALPLMSTNLRGGMVTLPVGGVRVSAFGGRVSSGSFVEPGLIGEPGLPAARKRFDTTAIGAFAEAQFRRAFTAAVGAMSFSGARRSGRFATATGSLNGRRLRMQADIAMGQFHGLASDNRSVDGTGVGADVTATFQATDDLAFQGRYTRIGRNFLSPQNGYREPVELRAAGVNWSPRKWLSASLNGSTSTRPGDPTRKESYATASVTITPSLGAPRFYISHTQANSRSGGASAFTLINASKDFRGWRAFVNATRVAAAHSATVNMQFGSSFFVSDRTALDVSQSLGSRGSLNGQADWRMSGLFHHRLSFSAGGGYGRSADAGVVAFERVTASLKLPRETSLQVSYTNSSQGGALVLSIRGSIFKKRNSNTLLGASISEANSFAKIRGRVYQDVNLNGVYDAADKPLSDVKVMVDASRYIVTDLQGRYSFETVTPGEHAVSLDLLSVRADLTLLTDGAQSAGLRPGKETSMDFRLVRTGRLHGRVWLDANANGKFDEGETPLADIRVVTGKGRDTLTDAEGFYTIGDLAPGEHVVTLDEQTLPEKTSVLAGSLTLQVYAGRETGDADLSVRERPAEIKNFGASRQIP